jgi:hypothetical protein
MASLGFLIAAGVTSETVVGGIGFGGAAATTGAVAAAASGVSFITGAMAKVAGEDVSNWHLVLSAVGAIPLLAPFRAATATSKGAPAVARVAEADRPPTIELGEIKPIASYRAGLYQLNGRGALGNDALVTFDHAGKVHMQVFAETTPGLRTIIWEGEIGTVSQLPSARPGTTQFGDQMEPLVRALVEKATGQKFQVKLPNAPGPDLVPVQ